ncbi:hypothetical protein Taro_029647 [Colocasia esculenta]|uniref:Uncharacterized protein n=1 Tax=Colocasia esculenta TaxID=4460 RepID=A0A843VVH5_COLES|nr:hypothetical protein [Colocasia esculenta]
MTQVPVRLPDSSCPLMVENVAWDGYNRSVSQRVCSEPFKHTFRAGDLYGGRSCCSVMLRVVPRSKVTVPARNLSAGVRSRRNRRPARGHAVTRLDSVRSRWRYPGDLHTVLGGT